MSSHCSLSPSSSLGSLKGCTLGLTRFASQVFLFAYYHDDVENIHDAGALFTLAVGSFGVLAGLFGCLRRDLYSWIT